MKCEHRRQCKFYNKVSETCNCSPCDYCGKYREFKNNKLNSEQKNDK